MEPAPGTERLLLGNEAIVRGALESGVDVYTYYPGTPSSEIGETFLGIFKQVGIKWVETSINEKVAVEVAGAAYARGATAMVGMKNVGLNVAADPLLALATTYPTNPNSAIVIIVADDPQQHSSAVEMDSRYFLKILKVPALEPSTPQECLEFTKLAFEISRKIKLPVIVRTVTMVSHARSNVTYGDLKASTIPSDFELLKEVNTASKLYFLKLKEDQIYSRLNRALEMSENSNINKISYKGTNSESKHELGIITCGVSYTYVVEALNFLDLSIPTMKIGFINPLPQKKIVEFLKQSKNVLVVEEMDAYLESQALAIAQKHGIKVKIYGKDSFSFLNLSETSLLSYIGELNPTKAALAICKLAKVAPKIDLETIESEKSSYVGLSRKPIMCPGCPHRTTGYALKLAANKIKKSTGKEVFFFQDIGCYTMLSYPPMGFANVKYCMGSSIALAQGVAHTDDSLNVAIIGDGTFFHSGIPAFLNGIHNRAPIVVLILDNGWIGMTGQQPHPGSDTQHYLGGKSKTVINLEDFLRGTGAFISVIKRSDYLNTYDNIENNEKSNDKYTENLKNAIIESGLGALEKRCLHAILVKDECVQKYIKRHEIFVREVNAELCTNCGMCYEVFLCPAIGVQDSKAFISKGLCLGCGICEEICPNNAIKKKT